MELRSLLARWHAEPSIGGNIVYWHSQMKRSPRWAQFPPNLQPAVVEMLNKQGIQQLYTHQAEAFQIATANQNCVIATGTASGKTMCFNLPVINSWFNHTAQRAVYIYPTKALAQDQFASLQASIQNLDPSLEDIEHQEPTQTSSKQEFNKLIIGVYDGDTLKSSRPKIRNHANIIFTNPDMLHTGIMPHHTSWAHFFSNLKYVVIDEIHIYRGVFGSHVANVLRRLKRICAFYGSQPQFILTSATIGNPQELAEQLIAEPVTLVSDDGSARGAQEFLIYNPPIVDRTLGIRRSAAQETVRLANDLIAYEIQTILFARSRRSVEITLTYLRQKIDSQEHLQDSVSSKRSSLIRGYRSGYLPHQRRQIEQALRKGEVRAVVATNALELGIDVGGMGAALLMGYPGTIAASKQQAGRAGRGLDDSLAVLITTAAPLDQFLAKNPTYFFDRSPERALINPDNPLILLDHLRCAAFELPISASEVYGELNTENLVEYLDYLVSTGLLHRDRDKYYWMAEKYPAQDISLRSASVDNILLQIPSGDTMVTIGEVDFASSHWMVHPGAVYLHESQTYFVDELDLFSKTARLIPSNTDYYTEPLQESTISLIDEFEQSHTTGAMKSHGEINVTSQMTGFRKIKWYTHENIGMGTVELPPTELFTTGYWFSLNERTVDYLRDQGLWSSEEIDYGPNWLKQRHLARERDDFTCQACGLSESNQQHDVHHRIPFRLCRDADGMISYRLANRLDNLVTLCRNCHRRAETAVRVRSGIAGLAYLCHNLAPIFLMCDSRDLGIHTDPKSTLTNGQPTIVLYDQIPAGIGLSQTLFQLHDELIGHANMLINECECEDGCPSCVGPGGESGRGGKEEAIAILHALTN